MTKAFAKTVQVDPRSSVQGVHSSTAAHSLGAVFLVGFMGAGKTSVGRVLGQRLNWLFEDLDDRIQAREGRSVPEIFCDSGEVAFRRAEHAALRELLEQLHGGDRKIVALGGGAFVQKENSSLLADSGMPVVFLDAPVDELWQRCCLQAGDQKAGRPLLRSQDEFRQLYRNRRHAYERASVQIETGNRTVETVADEIVKTLGLTEIAIRADEGEVE